MKTTLDSNYRVFMVVTSRGKSAFCNIDKLNKVVKELGAREGYFTVYEFWDNKPKKVTKANLARFFEGAGLKQNFVY